LNKLKDRRKFYLFLTTNNLDS